MRRRAALASWMIGACLGLGAAQAQTGSQTFVCPETADSAQQIVTTNASQRSLVIETATRETRLPCTLAFVDGAVEKVLSGPGAGLCGRGRLMEPVNVTVIVQGSMFVVDYKNGSESGGLMFDTATGVMRPAAGAPYACRPTGSAGWPQQQTLPQAAPRTWRFQPVLTADSDPVRCQGTILVTLWLNGNELTGQTSTGNTFAAIVNPDGSFRTRYVARQGPFEMIVEGNVLQPGVIRFARTNIRCLWSAPL